MCIRDRAGDTEVQFIFAHTVDHSGKDLKIEIYSSGTKGASWGIQDVKIDLIPCAKGCSQCTSCTKCSQCEEGLEHIRDLCTCKAGFQKVKVGDQYICDNNFDCGRNGVKEIKGLGTNVFADNKTLQADNWTVNGNPVASVDQTFQCEEQRSHVQRHAAEERKAEERRKNSEKNAIVKVESGPGGVNGRQTFRKESVKKDDSKSLSKTEDGKKPDGDKKIFRVVGLLGANDKVTRIYDALPPHFGLRVAARIYAIGTKNQTGVSDAVHDRISALAGGDVLGLHKGKHAFGKLRRCRNSNRTFQCLKNLWQFYPHNQSNLTLSFNPENLNLPTDSGWGIRKVKVVACKCPRGCAACSSATQCTSCLKESVEIGPMGICNKCKDPQAKYVKGDCIKNQLT
eukprot:TRINITY_DN3959_c0_g1_i10.p1 TRINITY_DN3959_c0_g1~~TRINITY_DN3959_c0_g1_i10.p1  ORF type:complete len:398 (+),score=74.38 TRINITY_DN3959_c0_g1_i10:66-1259(+)